MGELLQFRSTASVDSLKLKEVTSSRGRGVITEWLADHPGARAKFRVRVNNLNITPRVDWTIKQFKNLGGGLAEIKWSFSNKEFRALGFDQGDHFIMVLGCIHKGKVYDPPGWLGTARQRKGEAESGERTIIDFEP